MNVCGGPNNERNRLWKKCCKEVKFFLGDDFRKFSPEERYKKYLERWKRKYFCGNKVSNYF